MSYENPKIESSYQKNDIGKTLYDTVMSMKPERIVEYGVLHGYSTVCMAQALRDLGRGKVVAYDLWDAYPHKHGEMEKVQKTVDDLGLTDYVELKVGGFLTDLNADFFHIDISNTGDTIREIARTIPRKSTVLFEGGTRDRDKVEWMTKYNRAPIVGCGARYIILNGKFPGLSVLSYNR
jgi:DNA-directed RNA polymerase subunit N (RpoN/RPB10)